MTREVFKRWLRKHATHLEIEVDQIHETVDNLEESQKEVHKKSMAQIELATTKISEAINILRNEGQL